MVSQARDHLRGRDSYVGAQFLRVHVTFLPGRCAIGVEQLVNRGKGLKYVASLEAG
jgi:hypothetical protein